MYVRNDNGEEHVRAKRQTPNKFPEDDDAAGTKLKQLETTSKKNLLGEYYEYFYKEITNISQTTFELKDLKHYTNYQIILRACREKTNPESTEENCSAEAQIYALTKKKEENDIITVFDANMIPSNRSSGSIKVSWKPPENPNGLLLTYTIRYKKYDADHLSRSFESHCVKHNSSVSDNVFIIQVRTLLDLRVARHFLTRSF